MVKSAIDIIYLPGNSSQNSRVLQLAVTFMFIRMYVEQRQHNTSCKLHIKQLRVGGVYIKIP
jgi:hypothetical protein